MALPTPKSAREWAHYQELVRQIYAFYGSFEYAPELYLRDLDFAYRQYVEAKAQEEKAHKLASQRRNDPFL